MSNDEGDDWDNIDYDERLDEQSKLKAKNEEKQQKNLQQQNMSDGRYFFAPDQDDGGHYMNQKRNNGNNHDYSSHDRQQQGKVGGKKKPFEVHIQPYPFREIQQIRSYTEDPAKFDKLFFSTFGEFERFIESHRQKTPEILVDLLIIDVALLESPLRAHNKWLLGHLIKVDEFWIEMSNFIEGFFEDKWKDHDFLLKIDVRGFFMNIQLMLSNLIIENEFEEKIKEFYISIVEIMKKHPDNPHNCVDKIEQLLINYQVNQEFQKKYSIYPTLSDFSHKRGAIKSERKRAKSTENNEEGESTGSTDTTMSSKWEINHTKGKFESIKQYLENHLNFLKCEMFNEIRECFASLRREGSGLIFTEVFHKNNSNCNVYPKVRLHKSTEREKYFAITIKIHANIKNVDFSNKFFQGQMLLLTSKVEINDLIVATVLESKNVRHEVKVQIIRTENIENVFDRDLIMIEPTTLFFEPFYRTKEILQNLNEYNFPFKNQILNFEGADSLPSYLKAEGDHIYNYKHFDFDVTKSADWPTEQQLSLEKKQLAAIKRALTTEFSLIQGPPGTGKTYIGVEILKILLKNTKERISIITHSNNALDKFLLTAKKSIEKITVRLGAQSKKSEEIEDFLPKSEMLHETKKYMWKIEKFLSKEIEKLGGNDEEVFKKYCIMMELKDEAWQLNKFLNLNHNRVFGMTTSFATRHTSLNHLLKSGIVIVEEASEILESHLLASLTKHAKHVIMLGDQQQLRPHCSHQAKSCAFDISLFERLIDNHYPYTKLDVQRRMRPEISELVKLTSYLELEDSEEVLHLPKVSGMPVNLYCLSHNEEESKFRDGDSSRKNDFEALKIAELTNELLKLGHSPNDITILTCYDAQVRKLQEVLKKFSEEKIQIVTTDSYQGEESKIIILSLVKCNKTGEIGFLKEANRICVMMSRAKSGFYIVGNIEMFSGSSPLWNKVFKYLQANDLIGTSFPNNNLE